MNFCLSFFEQPVWTALYNLDRSNTLLNLCNETLLKNIDHWVQVEQNPEMYDIAIPDEISQISTKGDAILQPILDMEDDLIHRLRRIGKTSLRLPGEGLGRKDRRRSELLVSEERSGSGKISLRRSASKDSPAGEPKPSGQTLLRTGSTMSG